MVIFLIFSIPAGALLYFRHMYPGYYEGPEFWRPYLRGIAAFAVSVLPILLIIDIYPVLYRQGALYTRFFITDFLLFFIAALALFFVWERRKISVSYGKPLFISIAAFFTGYISFIGVFHAVINVSTLNSYNLFAYPVLLLLAFWIASALVYFFFVTGGWKRYLLLALIAVPPILYSLIPLLQITGFEYYALACAVLLIVLSVVLAMFLTKRRLIP
ncbi:MAG: hypothetical protein U5P10_08585 [Spirochaetia bacterium]|nr:hypothetical protein [Spirochaetia bacterium]